MDRSIIAPLEQMRDFDFVQFEHDVMCALGDLAKDCLSQLSLSATSQSVVAGFVAAQSSPSPNLTVNIGSGRVYTLAAADSTSDGSIAADATVICQQGRNGGQAITLVAPSAGQSQWNLIQVQFSQVDAVRTNDPNGGTVPFFNSANPSVPNNTSVNTVRLGSAVLQVITGSAATTGAEVPPQPTNGWQPLYLIDLAGGQSQILTAQMLIAGPSVGTGVPANYPSAPFMAGFQASHHGGTGGQAPKIKLASEVQGVLPYINMSPVRTLLSGSLNLYVATTGNDTNPGTSPASPFLTVQAAINAVYRNYDFNGNACTINIANGTYNFIGSSGRYLASFPGSPVGLNSSINLVGNVGSPGSVTLATTTGNGILAAAGASVTVSGFTLTVTGTNQGLVLAQGYGLVAQNGGVINIGPLVIGSCGTSQLWAATGGMINAQSPGGGLTLTGTCPSPLAVGFGGTLWLNGSTITVTGLTASIAMANGITSGTMQAVGVTFIGSATGQRYLVTSNAVINTQGAGANYFPGNSPGSASTGGLYL